jgi:hypothetical protein
MKINLFINKLIRLHKEELYDFYSSPNIFCIIKKNEMAVACSTYGEEDKLEGRGPFGRPCRRWRVILKKRFQEGGWGGGGTDWTDMALDRDRWRALVNAVMNVWVP